MDRADGDFVTLVTVVTIWLWQVGVGSWELGTWDMGVRQCPGQELGGWEGDGDDER